MVLGAGPPCQVLRFIQAHCHKCLRDEEKRLAEPAGSRGTVSLPYLKEPRVYYRGLKVNFAEVRRRLGARKATAAGITRPLPEGQQFQTRNFPPKNTLGIPGPVPGFFPEPRPACVVAPRCRAPSCSFQPPYLHVYHFQQQLLAPARPSLAPVRCLSLRKQQQLHLVENIDEVKSDGS